MARGPVNPYVYNKIPEYDMKADIVLCLEGTTNKPQWKTADGIIEWDNMYVPTTQDENGNIVLGGESAFWGFDGWDSSKPNLMANAANKAMIWDSTLTTPAYVDTGSTPVGMTGTPFSGWDSTNNNAYDFSLTYLRLPRTS